MPGGGGGGTTQGAQVFLPPNQGQAAQGFQDLTGGFQQAIAAGQTPGQLAFPQVQTATQNTINNPFQGGPITGTLGQQNYFQTQFQPQAEQIAQQLFSTGSQAGDLMPQIVNETIMNPLYGQASHLGQATAPVLTGLTPGIINQANQAAPQLSGAAGSILNQAFDPQQALYNRTSQQLMDQLGAFMGGSQGGATPYGAGLASDALRNFNIDWQNQQLQRQIAGGGAANALQAGALNQLTGAGSAVQGLDLGAINALLGPAQAQGQAADRGVAALGGINNLMSGNLQTGLGDLGTVMNSMPGIYSGPYQAFNQIQGNNMGALQNLIALGNQQYTLPQQTIGDLSQYLGLGQNAAGLANTIGATNFNQQMAGLSGLGQLGFGALGPNSPFSSGGALGGLFGGGGGLAAGAPGVLSGAPAEALLSSGLATDASFGPGGFLASAAPIAAGSI